MRLYAKNLGEVLKCSTLEFLLISLQGVIFRSENEVSVVKIIMVNQLVQGITKGRASPNFM